MQSSAAEITCAGSINLSDCAAAGPAATMRTAASAESLDQAFIDCLAGFEQLFHRVDTDVEVLASTCVQLDLDDLLDSAGAEHAGDADVEVVDAVLAGQMRGAGEDAFLVLEEA